MIIHSGLLPEAWKASTTSRRLMIRARFCPVASSSLLLQLLGILFQINGLAEAPESPPRPFRHGRQLCPTYPQLRWYSFSESTCLYCRSVSPCVQNDIGGKVQHLLQGTGRKIQDQTHTAGDSLEIPDVGYRSRQCNMTHALTAYAGLGNFHAAAVADHAFIANLLVLSAMALPVLAGSENSLAEQTVLFRL